VLVIGFAGVSGGVATRLIALGYRPISVREPREALARLEREHEPVRAALVPASADFLTPGALWRLSRRSGRPLCVTALGSALGDGAPERLRRAGVQFALPSACTDRELRFALNRALCAGAHGQSRLHARVATDLVARIRIGAREKAGLVYSLCAEGCYVETDRPCPPDGFVSLHLPLPGGGVELPARVLYANVPGDFERANLPHGMALSFLDAASEQRAQVARYVAQRLGEQGVPARGDDAVASGGMARVWARLRAVIGPIRAGADA
jgi:hypothetical protein